MATPLHYANAIQDTGGLHKEFAIATARDAVDSQLQAFIEKSTSGFQHWEVETHAFYTLLLEKGLASAAEVRRAIEQLPHQSFQTKTYYEKWAAALAHISVDRGTIQQSELDEALGQPSATPEILFEAGSFVRVKPEDSTYRYRRPHLRTPGYLFGVIGKILNEPVYYLEDPDISSHRPADGPKQPVYRVLFSQKDIWEGYQGSIDDTIDIEIWQPWLEAATATSYKKQQTQRASLPIQQSATSGRRHAHDHDHVHEERAQVEQTAVEREGDAANRSAFAKALIQLFVSKGIVSAGEVRDRINLLESYGQNPMGPKLVARAWVDASFKARLLEDGMTAAQELGFSASGYPPKGGLNSNTQELTGNVLVALEDSETEFHVIVCTLCSCYPTHILGLAPSWYKSRAYRARSVRDPRAVLREFGTELPAGVHVRVHDSTADTRYFKIPLRPSGTEDWSEADLIKLVTRDSLIGVSYPRSPEQL